MDTLIQFFYVYNCLFMICVGPPSPKNDLETCFDAKFVRSGPPSYRNDPETCLDSKLVQSALHEGKSFKNKEKKRRIGGRSPRLVMQSDPPNHQNQQCRIIRWRLESNRGDLSKIWWWSGILWHKIEHIRVWICLYLIYLWLFFVNVMNGGG